MSFKIQHSFFYQQWCILYRADNKKSFLAVSKAQLGKVFFFLLFLWKLIMLLINYIYTKPTLYLSNFDRDRFGRHIDAFLLASFNVFCSSQTQISGETMQNCPESLQIFIFFKKFLCWINYMKKPFCKFNYTGSLWIIRALPFMYGNPFSLLILKWNGTKMHFSNYFSL